MFQFFSMNKKNDTLKQVFGKGPIHVNLQQSTGSVLHLKQQMAALFALAFPAVVIRAGTGWRNRDTAAWHSCWIRICSVFASGRWRRCWGFSCVRAEACASFASVCGPPCFKPLPLGTMWPTKCSVEINKCPWLLVKQTLPYIKGGLLWWNILR